MEEPLVETWNIHDRINLYLLEAVPAEALGSTLAPKHRSIGQIFAHVHNVRLMWLKAAAPDLLEGVAKLEGAAVDKATIAAALEASGRAIEALLRKSLAAGGAGGKIKGFKPHVDRLRRLPDLSRVAPPQPGRLDPQELRPSARSEDLLRPVGVGRAVRAPEGVE